MDWVCFWSTVLLKSLFLFAKCFGLVCEKNMIYLIQLSWVQWQVVTSKRCLSVNHKVINLTFFGHKYSLALHILFPFLSGFLSLSLSLSVFLSFSLSNYLSWFENHILQTNYFRFKKMILKNLKLTVVNTFWPPKKITSWRQALKCTNWKKSEQRTTDLWVEG